MVANPWCPEVSKIIWSHVIHFTHLPELVEPHLFYIPPLAVHKHISLLPPLPAFVTIWAIGNTQRKISVTKNVKMRNQKLNMTIIIITKFPSLDFLSVTTILVNKIALVMFRGSGRICALWEKKMELGNIESFYFAHNCFSKNPHWN